MVDGDQLGAVGEGGFDLDVGDHLGTPSITSARVSMVVPRHQLATVLPSRAPSMMAAVISATASG
jgi:hypothetical protein